MLGALVRFMTEAMRTKPHLLAWIIVLTIVNGIAPMWFLTRLEAQVVLATFLLSVCLTAWLAVLYGFTRIVSVGRVLWVPLVVFLLVRANALAMDVYGIWVGMVVVLDMIALMVDVRDVMLYVRGDRDEVVKRL